MCWGGTAANKDQDIPFLLYSIQKLLHNNFLGPKRLFQSRGTVLFCAGIAMSSSSLVEPGVPVPSGELTCAVVVESRLGKSRSGSSIDVDVGLVVVEVVGVEVAPNRGRRRRRSSAPFSRAGWRLEGDGVGDLRHLFEIPT